MRIEHYWYQNSLHPLLMPLLPLAKIYGLGIQLRSWAYRLGLKKSYQPPIPVLVIGNITVGGTGKTPLTAWLAHTLSAQGYRPGIALRGVGGKPQTTPQSVLPQSDPLELGDEAVLLANNTHCPVIACIQRSAAVKALHQAGCDIVICDDGLQHYRLGRHLEIAVIDGHRYFGNGRLLPAGPLRESIKRLNQVDFIVVNEAEAPTKPVPQSYDMRLQTQALEPFDNTQHQQDLSVFAGQSIHAVAGLGNPQRFFKLLKRSQLDIIPHAFPDHHAFSCSDLDFNDNLPILMTEKDAIKCKRLPLDPKIKARLWFLPVKAELNQEFKDQILKKIGELKI